MFQSSPMILWIFAMVLLGVFGLYGLKRGGIRGGIILLGLIVGIFVCRPVGHMLSPVFTAAGYKHPLVQMFLGPAVAFILVMILAMIFAHLAQEKMDFKLKYFSDDNSRARFERLNANLGLSIGLLNGMIYFFILLMPFYVLGYFTFQVNGAEADTKMKLASDLRSSMHTTHLDKVAAGFDPAPPELYDASDVIGLLLHNRLLENRMFRYPPFLTLAERSDLQELFNDTQFQTLFQSGNSKLEELLANPKVHEMVNNVDLYQAVSSTLGPNLEDFKTFLETGHSPKFDEEKILGLWDIDLQKVVDEDKKKRGNISFTQAKLVRSQILNTFNNGMLVATTDNQLILKSGLPGANGVLPIQMKGIWKKEASGGYSYVLGSYKGEVVMSGNDLKVNYKGFPLTFTKEN
ncbi:MAG: hypothetical protein JWN25_3282 [Verrucomicrobiales bacterium]|nr:hypothetical protein [Verrucomicrobiales bacterium]